MADNPKVIEFKKDTEKLFRGRKIMKEQSKVGWPLRVLRYGASK